MKIEIKNIKHSEWASHETDCFTASVYIDGKRAGTVRNDGMGGCNFYHPHSIEEALNQYAATLPPFIVPYEKDGKQINGEMPQTADDVIYALLQQHLYQNDLKRHLKSHVLFVRDNQMLNTDKLPPEKLRGWLANPALPAKLRSDKILNLMPFAEALQLYIKHARGEVTA